MTVPSSLTFPDPTRSVLQKISLPLAAQKGVRLCLKRDDLIHYPPVLPLPEGAYRGVGNKWRKLKYNLADARAQGHCTLLTFGGAYSNHLYATAAAGVLYGFRTVGLVRGERHTPLNPTLQFATDCGMALHYVDRPTYRQKHTPAFVADLRERFGDFYLLPEGGSNAAAVRGCAEIGAELPADTDWVVAPVGTGGTLAGLAAGAPPGARVLGVAVLKGAAFLYDDIGRLLAEYTRTAKGVAPAPWQLTLDYHGGGYAKTRPELWAFIDNFRREHDVPLEPVYSGKMMYALLDLLKNDFFAPGSRVVALHTGGLR